MKQEIYANLNKGGVSVRENGKVQFIAGYVVMANAEFVVQRSGYERTIKEKQRNVHAFARGTIVAECRDNPTQQQLDNLRAKHPRITYNPFRSDKFTCNGKPISAAAVVIMVVTERKNDKGKTLCEMFLIRA